MEVHINVGKIKNKTYYEKIYHSVFMFSVAVVHKFELEYYLYLL